ncbi:spore germination protein [Thermoflavimicrobium daqui]|uniref:Spore germination protein n=2 Tax=Thermoflavimicrobium daqui TaxID=2137476 RepID=A0A364K850_9BACL|nr:spore germination protein [Thermoflavimicrobium daqui]
MRMKNRSFRLNRSKKKKKILEKRYEEKLENKVGNLGIYADVEENVKYIETLLGKAGDLKIRQFTIQYKPETKAAMLYLDELASRDANQDFVLRPLMTYSGLFYKDTKKDVWELAYESLVQAGELKVEQEMKEAVDAILRGDTVLFINGYEKVMVIGTCGWKTRGIGEPRAESVVRGPREGLSETLLFSLGMIRRRLKDPDLRVKMYSIGKRTKTSVSLIYLEGVVQPDILKEVKNRIQRIDIDGVLETGYIEEFIQDQTWSPFPQLQNTERPDAVVAHLLEGKIAILVDGTPHALIAPAVFTQFYYSPEDYYERFHIATFLRLIRLVSFFISLMLPALYIAFVSYHPEMIPSKLQFKMASGRATVPFPSIIEALLMEISVEILREASIRLPGPIGPTIGIVGALVIGDAAVSAGLVSPAMVIVVGLTTISSYANPSYNAAISVRLLRFPLMISAGIFGLYGVMLGLVLLLLHLVQLRSMGIPYMAPYTPLNTSDFKDTLVRMPWKWMDKRPSFFHPKDSQRQEEKSEAQDQKNGGEAS